VYKGQVVSLIKFVKLLPRGTQTIEAIFGCLPQILKIIELPYLPIFYPNNTLYLEQLNVIII